MTLGFYLAHFQVQPLPPGFQHGTCRDHYGRNIDYYLSRPEPGKKLPLLIFVGGSGAQSMWIVRNGQIYGGLQNLVLSQAKGRFRVLAVEKPGISFGYSVTQPGTAIGAPQAFLEEDTLPLWAEANDAALRACLREPGIDPKRVLAVGHSEGGIVVSKLAALDHSVTDVATLAGGGPCQLFDFLNLFGRETTLDTLAKIRKDPMSTTQFAWGHPFRRWSTYFATSPLDEALHSSARFYVAQGTKDQAVYPLSADVLYSELLGHGRDVTLDRIEDADHGFSTVANDMTGKDFLAVVDRVMQWFFAGPSNGKANG